MSYKCPECDGVLENYLLSPWMFIGKYQSGDYICNKCKKVFIENKQLLEKEMK